MIAFAPWQALLDGLGAVLSWLYDGIGNLGVSIIVLTILIKLVLLPLGIKQIKSMQHMQAIQPQIKALQKKHKGNKQKIQEETMKLYREAGMNPLGGCLPVLLQFPILIAMYSVLRTPAPTPAFVSLEETPTEFANNHYPEDEQLFKDVTSHDEGALSFLFMNLQCSLVQAGSEEPVPNSEGEPSPLMLKCGDDKVVDTIPYALLLLVMVGSGFYQQRQMQKVSPPGAQSAQQQAILKYLPLMFAFFGLTFPAGLVLYWTTQNLFTIGQQALLLRAGHIGPEAVERRLAEQRAKAASGEPAKKGFMARMMERAEGAQEQQQARKPESQARPKGGTARPAKGSSAKKGGSTPRGRKRPGGSGSSGSGSSG